MRDNALMTRLRSAVYRFEHESLATVLSHASHLWHLALSPGQRPPARARRILTQRMRAMFERDLANADAGYYPRELLDFPLFSLLQRAPEAIWDAPRMLWRKYLHGHASLPDQAELGGYPAYYRRNFHWQPDGWLSAHSARVYDVEVEFLFLGAAGVMRRMTIPPVIDHIRFKRRPRVLDIACGTGRFLRQLHAASPHARLYGLDLSPYYVAEARRALADVPCVSFLVENAESVPLESGSFQAITSVFLFHELPHDARRNVLREAYRLLEPGGVLSICDSLQRTDPGSEELADYFDWFPSAYHEPYYRGYVRDDLGALLAECGFGVDRSEVHAASKIVVGRKPTLAS